MTIPFQCKHDMNYLQTQDGKGGLYSDLEFFSLLKSESVILQSNDKIVYLGARSEIHGLKQSSEHEVFVGVVVASDTETCFPTEVTDLFHFFCSSNHYKYSLIDWSCGQPRSLRLSQG